MTEKQKIQAFPPITMTLTRRGFVKMGGALSSRSRFPQDFPSIAPESPTSLDPSVLASWLEITATTPSSPAPAEPRPAQA